MSDLPSAHPELRSDILTEVLAFIAPIPGPVMYTTVVMGVLDAYGEFGDQICSDINAAIFLLLRAGLIESNKYDGAEMTFSGDATLTSSQRLTTYVFHDTSGYFSREDDAV